MGSCIPKRFVDDMGLKVDFTQFNSPAYKFLHLRVVVEQLTLVHSMQNRKDVQGNKLKDFNSMRSSTSKVLMISQNNSNLKVIRFIRSAPKNCDNIISKKSKVDIATGNSDKSQMFFSLFLQN